MDLDVVIEDLRWDSAGLRALAERAVPATLLHLGLKPSDWSAAILGCDDARIAALNEDFREKPRPTNVLSWPSAERGAVVAGARPELPVGQDPELGDIAIAFETTMSEADAGGLSLADHVTHLIVHATLHLLGYDHVRDADGDLMEATETAILQGLGVADPYDRDQGGGPGRTDERKAR